MRIDLYTQPHKNQRKMLFALSTKVGDANFKDTAIVTEIHHDLMLLTNELRHHAFSEETFVHPLLAKKIPSAEKSFHEEHETLKKHLDHLETTYTHLQDLGPHYKKRENQGLEFYRMLNRFISTYFMHINEEEYVMQNLWEVSIESEVIGMMIAFQTYHSIDEGEKWLATHLPAMSIDEQQLMFKTTQLLASEEIFITMRQLSEKILGTKKWAPVLEKLN